MHAAREEFAPAVDLEAPVQLLDVLVCRRRGNAEPEGDLLLAVAFQQAREYLAQGGQIGHGWRAAVGEPGAAERGDIRAAQRDKASGAVGERPLAPSTGQVEQMHNPRGWLKPR